MNGHRRSPSSTRLMPSGTVEEWGCPAMTRKSRPPNQLHSKMDGFDVRSAVVAIVTTNRPDARRLVKNVLGSNGGRQGRNASGIVTWSIRPTTVAVVSTSSA